MAKSKDTLKTRRERRIDHELHSHRAHSIASIASADIKVPCCIELIAPVCASCQNIAILFSVSFTSCLTHCWFPVSGRQRYTILFMVLATLLILTIEGAFTLLTMATTSFFAYYLPYSLTYCPYIIALYASISTLPLPLSRSYNLIRYFLTTSYKQIATSTLCLPLTAPANHIHCI